MTESHANFIPEKDWFRFFVTYRGKPTDQLAMSFKKLNTPVKVIMTTRKLTVQVNCTLQKRPTIKLSHRFNSVKYLFSVTITKTSHGDHSSKSSRMIIIF